jgi:hypothetical protein
MKAIPFEEVAVRLAQLPLRSLTLDMSTIRRENAARMVDGRCERCGKVRRFYVNHLLAGRSSGCPCSVNHPSKYDDSRAFTLGRRYDAILQRCNDPERTSYCGRGIQVQFESREHFIRWALAKWPDSDFKGLEFDREDNDGHYHPDNLRLVTSKANKENRRHATAR